MSEVISKPISLSKLANILGCKQDLGTICTSNNINKWAKYKPVAFKKIGQLTEAELRSVGYGLSKGTSNNAVYTKPSGGENTPYRLSDFVGYRHDAPCGFAFKQKELTYDLLDDTGDLTISLEDDEDSVCLCDVYDVWFNGFTFVFTITATSSNSPYQYQKTISNISQRGQTFTIPRSVIQEVGVTSSIGAAIQIYATNGSGMTDLLAEISRLKVTADTGVTISNFNANVGGMKIGTTSNPTTEAANYLVARNNVLNLENSDLYIGQLTYNNRAKNGQPVTNQNLCLYMEWSLGSNTKYYKRIPLHYGTPTSETEIAYGAGGTSFFACKNSEIPKLTNAGSANTYVTMQIQYYHNNSGWVGITDEIELKVLRTEGIEGTLKA